MMINIESLKRNILSLALEGKLTEQLASDGDSKLLIAESARKKQESLKLKKIELNEPEEEDKVFSIPVSWNWVKLSNISQIESGGTPSRSERKYWNGTIPWLKIGDLNSKHVTKSSEYITELGLNNSSARIFKKGTILYTIFATIGVVSVLDIDASTNQAIAGLTIFGNIDRDYLYYVLVGLKDILVGKSHGMTQSNINLTILKNIFIPMPPLEEQKRIVAKLDKIFAELDKIDEKQIRLATIQEKMEAKILKLAIQGKLVEQRFEEGTGEELFKHIQLEKQELIKQGKIKKEKPLPAIEEDEIPFEIPSSWKWVRLGNLGDNVPYPFADGPFGSNLKREHYTKEKQVRIIQLSNVGESGWKGENEKYTTFAHLETIARSEVNNGDIVIAKMMPAGRAIIVPDLKCKFVLSSDCVKFAPNSRLEKEYLYYAINSDPFKKQVLSETNGIGRERTSLSKLKEYLIPLPPLDEQKRIVAKIEELLPLCRGN